MPFIGTASSHWGLGLVGCRWAWCWPPLMLSGLSDWLLGAMLGFSAGTLSNTATSDLLPVIQRRYRGKALFLGIVVLGVGVRRDSACSRTRIRRRCVMNSEFDSFGIV